MTGFLVLSYSSSHSASAARAPAAFSCSNSCLRRSKSAMYSSTSSRARRSCRIWAIRLREEDCKESFNPPSATAMSSTVRPTGRTTIP